MGHYDPFSRPRFPSWEERLKSTHPFWGPLGCAFAFLFLLMGYALAVLFLQGNAEHHWIVVPRMLRVPGADPWLLLKGVLTLTFGFLLYALWSLVYALLARVFNATQRVPLDIDPIRMPRHLSLAQALRPLWPLLSLGLGMNTVLWLRSKPWFNPPPGLEVPGPLPDALLYLLAAVLWWFVLLLLWGGINILVGTWVRHREEQRRKEMF